MIEKPEEGTALKYASEKYKTAELCMAAILNSCWNLRDIPEAMKTAELCMAAVQMNGSVLGDVPEELKTAELCLAAIKSGVTEARNHLFFSLPGFAPLWVYKIEPLQGTIPLFIKFPAHS